MGKYTFIDNPKVDSYIDQYLKRVIEAIFEYMPNLQVRSIILAGSFGKGEGSVLLSGDEIKPLRDFDICLIVPSAKVPSAYLVQRLQEKLRERFCIITDPSYQLTSDQLPEVSITTLDNINSNPDISSYDLKKCKVLYGEDIRPKIKWELTDIPLRTNGRALFQKSIALIGAFHSEYLKSGIPEHVEDSFIRETSRAYIEICVGLCLLAKSYHSSCITRLGTIREIYRKDFNELYRKIPDLVEKIEASTKYKLDPTNNKISVNPIDYWFQTRDDLGEIIQYYFNRYLDIPYSNWEKFSSFLEHRLTQEYYIPVLSAFFKNRSFNMSSLLLNSFNLLFNVRENLKYSEHALRKGSLSLPLFYGLSSPAIKVFSTSPLILFSINQNGRIDDQYIKLALKKLRFVRPRTIHFGNKWDEARSKFLDLVFAINMI